VARSPAQRLADIVEDFNARIRMHPTLAEPFTVVGDWSEHKARLTQYWWRSLGGANDRRYRFDVMARHAPMTISSELLADWLHLFAVTLRDHLPDELARPWYERARAIGASLCWRQERNTKASAPSSTK
jgi:hemoglobin